MINTDHEALTPAILAELLAKKTELDDIVRKEIERRTTFSEPISLYDEHGIQLHRNVCIVPRGTKTDRLLSLIKQQAIANKALLDRAPQYFDSKSSLFRVPQVIHEARTVAVAIHDSASVRTHTGKQIAGIIKKHIKRLKLMGQQSNDKQLKAELSDTIRLGEMQIDGFLANADKEYKRRSIPTRDMTVVVRRKNPANPKDILPADKHHVDAGGTIIIRSRQCKKSDISYRDTTGETTMSIYDDIIPIETILNVKANYYDADELNKAHIAKQRLRTDMIMKKRPQSEGLIS